MRVWVRVLVPAEPLSFDTFPLPLSCLQWPQYIPWSGTLVRESKESEHFRRLAIILHHISCARVPVTPNALFLLAQPGLGRQSRMVCGDNTPNSRVLSHRLRIRKDRVREYHRDNREGLFCISDSVLFHYEG